MGKLFFIDLSDGKILEETPDEVLLRDYIGGYGIGSRIMYSRQRTGVEPLGEDNMLGILTGPLTGTPALAGSRYTVVGKSPLTNTWGDSNSGGFFGPSMKFAGCDGIFLTGISDKPVYIFINDGKAEIRDASHLWGKDTYETEETLRAELGKDIEVACIGPFGEKRSLISAIINNKGRAAGRSGLAAVMGSKNVKAVVVKGKIRVPMVDENRANDLRKKYMNEFTGPISFFKQYGTPAFIVAHTEDGDSPVKNWGGTAVADFPDVDSLSAEHLSERLSKKYACYRCPVACGDLTMEGTGEYRYTKGSHRPEYETLAMFGPNCLNSNLDSIIMANDICNRYGVDTISCGAAIAFAIECFENGLINKADTDGIEMTWGNHESIISMTEKLARREGFGAVLADGVKGAAEEIGKGADQFAIHIQGQEMPAHDPKFALDLATSYKLDATPGRHTQGSEERQAPGLIPRYDRSTFSGRGEIHKKGSCMGHIVNCIGMCSFVYGCLSSVDAVAEFMSAVTGWDMTTEELLKSGERIANIRLAFNLREGLNPVKFKVPDRVIGRPPKTEGPTAGVTVDEAQLYGDYLEVMDWDPETGRPSKRKLRELGLEDLIQDIWS
jgi:aldehyde:ferredoxin oxidoreductase